MHADDLFQNITDELIAAIEAGTSTWRMPWHTIADAGTPVNVDGRAYRGLNALWLPLTAAAQGWDSGVWATYRGWQRHGAQVRRGEKGTPVVLWKPTTTAPTGRPDGDDTDTTDEPDPTGSTRRRLVARVYTVFAAEQADNTGDIIQRRRTPHTERDTPQRLEHAEHYFAQLDAHVIEGGNRASYQPATDTIRIPTLAQFDTAAHYYATRAHETVHWTGHTSRLDRELTGRFGSDAYAAEELVAELGAAMWCAQAHLSTVTRDDHAAYLAGWLRILRADPKALVTVASRAQGALDWLNTRAGITTAAAGTEVA